jgi:fatty acyl-CoA reductase
LAEPAAFFDVDGTLTRTTILDPLAWYQRSRLGSLRYRLWLTGLVLDIPRLMWIDRRSRSRVNTVFFRRYAGLSLPDIRDFHEQAFAGTLQGRLFPSAVACLNEHRRQGHRIILVTGGLEVVMRPLARHLGAVDVLATTLIERAGVLTGELACVPIAEEQKGVLVREYAAKHGIDLTQSFAYTDSIGDLPMLDAVGRPVAVNADARLRKLAAERGWPLHDWKTKAP